MNSTILKSCCSAVIIAFLIVGCSTENTVDPIQPAAITLNELSNSTYGLVVKTEDNPIVLLGRLDFKKAENEQVSGTCNLETWGENSLFPTLAINNGTGLPISDNSATFTASMAGSMVLLKINLPSSDNTLGIAVDGILNDKLVGQVSLLPDNEFSGSFEAVKIKDHN